MKIRSHRELDVYKMAFNTAMQIYDLSKNFPKEEIYSLTDQIRRSSRSVCANLGEAFRKRRYPKAFIAKLNDSEGESGETQVWLEIAFHCNYINEDQYNQLDKIYENIIGKLVNMSLQPEKWSY
ncbi:MAG: four helix bundle protein [Bacteroidales bacterium]|nr:four helix bundle protein [Bacteroidales bacterium]